MLKKACIITTRYLPDLGGSELLAKTIVEYLHSKNYIIEVITHASMEYRDHSKFPYKIHEIGSDNFFLFNEIIRSNNYEFCLFVCDLHSSFLNFYNLSSRNNFCILNIDERTYQVKDRFTLATDNLKKFNCVFTFTKDGVANKFLEENNINNLYVQNFSRDVLQTTINEEYKTKIRKLFNNNSKIILYPAAYEERKNQKYLLSHLNGSSSLREFNWLFIGAVSDKRYLEDCMNFTLENKINAKFLKASSDTGYIDKLYQAVDLVCLGSMAEGMPLVLLEALSAGIPWVCTDVGGVRGVLGDSNTGKIISVWYSQIEMYEAIKLSMKTHSQENSRNLWNQHFKKEIPMNLYENYIQGACI